MAKDWMKALNKLEGAVEKSYNPFAYVLRSPSPSVNFTFGNSHGLPFGYTLILYGPPAGGKSLLSNAFIGQLHKDDPEAIAEESPGGIRVLYVVLTRAAHRMHVLRPG